MKIIKCNKLNEEIKTTININVNVLSNVEESTLHSGNIDDIYMTNKH